MSAPLNEPLRAAIDAMRDAPVRDESLLRALTRARQLDRGAAIALPPVPRRRVSCRITRRSLLAGAVAAGVLAVGTSWLWRASVSWAEVGEALRAKAWLHGVAKVHNGQSSEGWFSFDREVSASREDDSARFDDMRLGVRYEYDPEKSQIVRSLMPDATAGRSFSEFFRAVSRGQVRNGQTFSGQEVVAQEQRRVVADGREWLEYDLTLRAGNDLTVSRGGRMRLRVDPESHLPHSMSLSELAPARDAGREPQQIEFVFDYPQGGPVDIYDLGVPRGTKLVDLVPSPNLSRIVAAVESGRYRFDAYVAIVTQSSGDAPWYGAFRPTVFWKKGDCWRAEAAVGERDRAAWPPAAPPDDVDRAAWWRAQLKHYRWQAVEICDGTRVYRRPVNQAGEWSQDGWQAVAKVTPGKAIDEALNGVVRGCVLEGYAYPSTVQKPAHVFTVEIDPHPTEGPLDCLLVRYQATDAVKRNDTFLDGRYWVDPAKGYVTRQYFLGDCHRADGRSTTETMTMEGLERSPHGFWYPTLIRRKVTRDPPPGGNWSGETVKRFFVDFEADIPDEFFLPKDRELSD